MNRFILAAIVMAGLVNPALAADLSITDAFSRATPGNGPGVAYLTIHGGATPDRLVGASSQVAAKVELHTMSMKGDVMQMREVDAVEIPANAPIKFAPGGLHIMLMGLKAPLKTGETIPLTLTFEHAGTRTVDVPVGSLGATGPMAPMQGMSMKGMPGMQGQAMEPHAK
jgi:copper(I)-binding protein